MPANSSTQKSPRAIGPSNIVAPVSDAPEARLVPSLVTPNDAAGVGPVLPDGLPALLTGVAPELAEQANAAAHGGSKASFCHVRLAGATSMAVGYHRPTSSATGNPLVLDRFSG